MKKTVKGQAQHPAFSVVGRSDAEAALARVDGGRVGLVPVPGMGAEPTVVHQPGGDVVSGVLHPAFQIFEQLDRKLPDEGWFGPGVTPERPTQFQITSFQVPKGTALWLFDYEFAIYRPSGVDPGDFIRAESGRFSNQLGFDLTVSGQRLGTIRYQLDPTPTVFGRQEFEAPTGSGRATPAAFNRASTQSFASSASPGLSLLPATNKRMGPRNGPFTFIVDDGANVSLGCVIFNRLRSPVACVEGRMAGYLLHQNFSEALLNRIRPR